MAKRKTTDKFKQEVLDAVGDEYKVTGEYVKAKTKIGFFHFKCSQPFDMTPDNFKNGQRCPHCFGKKRKTTQQFKEEVFKLEGDKYEVIGEYVNTKTKIDILHNECGSVYHVTPQQFIRGDRCTNCRYKKVSEMKSLTLEEFKERVYSQVQDEYVVIGEYTGANEPIKMIHKVCGQEISMTPNNFYHHKKRCMYCSGSKGELAVLEWLVANSFSFKKEYKFEDCKNKRVLPFDFAVLNNDEDVKMLIEFHGIHHYESVKGWGGRGKLERAKLTDGIKEKYCIDNGIELIVIPYWDFDKIESILEERLLSEASETQSSKLE